MQIRVILTNKAWRKVDSKMTILNMAEKTKIRPWHMIETWVWVTKVSPGVTATPTGQVITQIMLIVLTSQNQLSFKVQMVNKRHSLQILQKYKEFLDTEYPVIGFKEGEGAEAGCVIWLCRTPEGREFACRPRGTREDRQALFADGASYVGKPLTVRYQELTDEGLPRFPVGITFRDYE